MAQQTIGVAVGVSALGLLLLAGVGAGAFYLAHRSKATAAPTGTTPATGTSSGGLPPIGSTPVTSADLSAQLERERQARLAEERRVLMGQKQAELARINNEMDRVAAQLNNLDAQPMPAEIVTRWSLQHETDCKNSRAFGAFFGLDQCWKYRNLSDGYQAKADADWSAQRQTLKTPYQTQLSNLDAQKKGVLADIQRLSAA